MNLASRLGVASGTLAFVVITIACAGKGSPKTANSPKAPQSTTETRETTGQKPSASDSEATAKAKARAKANLQAEQEAEAKNEANRIAYEAEVVRLKEEHEQAIERFNSKKAKFDKSFEEYQRSKIEFEAARKMLQARGFYDDSNDKSVKRSQQETENLMEIARGRFREIIKLYPESESAQDAKTLLEGGTVKNKKLPAQPLPPVGPPRLQPLSLPAPPTPVAPVYPIDPEDAKREEAAQRAKEAAQRAKEEITREGLTLYSNTLHGSSTSLGGNTFNAEITGTVMNNSGHRPSYAQIQFGIYDDSGALVGTALANINGLEAGGRWNFRATALTSGWKTFKFSEMSGF